MNEIVVVAGVILMFIAIVGKKIELKEVKIGDLTNTQRIIIGALGVIVLIMGFWQPIPIPPPGPTPTPVTTPTLTPVSTPTPTPSPILTPTPTFTPINVSDAYYPSGWMGDWGDITLDDSCTDNPHSEPTCIKIAYSAARSQGKGWAGIYWQYPDSNWGDNPDGRDLTGATKLTFWARGEKGEEKAEFKVGGITGKYPDTIQPAASTGVIILSDKWQQYTIDLADKDLSHIIGGFCWVTNKNQNPYGCTIYLDDVRFE